MSQFTWKGRDREGRANFEERNDMRLELECFVRKRTMSCQRLANCDFKFMIENAEDQGFNGDCYGVRSLDIGWVLEMEL